MANHIVLNSRFNPFSYQEMLHPVQMATQSHQQLEGELGEISSQTEAIGAMTNPETDPESYAKYKAYTEQVQEQARQLGSQGLQPGSRRGLMSVRDSFASEIMPIAAAYTKREQLSHMLSQARLQNPTLIIDKDPSVMSLDEFVRNPSWQPRTHQGSMLTQQSMQVYSNLAKQMSEDPDMIKSILGGQYFEILKKAKFNIGDIMEALVNSENAAPELIRIREDLLRSSGIPEWGNPQAEQQAIDAINQGMWAALGQDQSQVQANKNYGMTGGGAGGKENSEAQRIRAIATSAKIEDNPEIVKYKQALEDFKNGGNANILEVKRRLEENKYDGRNKFETLDEATKEIYRKADVDYIMQMGTLTREDDEKTLKRLEADQKRRFEELGVDFNSDVPVGDQLDMLANESIKMYSGFDLKGGIGAYDHLETALISESGRRQFVTNKPKDTNIRNRKGKTVSYDKFTKSITKGIIGVYYNRNANDPELQIITKDREGFTIDASMITGLHETLDAFNRRYQESVEFVENIMRLDIVPPELEPAYMEAVKRLENYDVQEYTLVVDGVMQAFNLRAGNTETKKFDR